jgi:signal transduction histidine kinase
MSPIAFDVRVAAAPTAVRNHACRLGDRVRKVPANVQDAALAIALAAGAEAEVIIRGATDPATLILVAVGGLSLLARRRAPWVMTGAFLAALLGRTLIVGGQDSDVVSFAGVLVAYSIGAHMLGRGSLIALGVLLAGYLVDQVSVSGFSAGLVPAGILLLGFPWLAGRALSSHRLLTGELRARTAQLEREREERARLAVLQERSRLAVQINDVVTRAIAAMVSWADNGRAAVGGEPVRVEQALRQMEHDGRDALAEMRRLLGVLRTDDSQTLAPQPSLAEVDRLVETARGSGMDIGLSVEGDPRPLPTGVEVSAYRIVQEALRDAREQRDGSIRVTVGYSERDLRLEVSGAGRDGALPALNEHWVAIRERVALYGGALVTDRAKSGGYTLTARLPLEASGV